ncbi:MAG TPA: flagellar FliJ family protein [Clostridia bacterium]|nr:flagellar FliJ family protein [Clostridia bacterium]
MNLKGFKFSLEAPLKVKGIHKTELEIKLAKAKNEMDDHKRTLDRLSMESDGIQSRLGALLSTGIRAADLIEVNKYLGFLGDKIVDSQHRYHKASDKFTELRNSLIGLMNEIDMLEKLRDQHMGEYLKGMQKKEERDLEERINYQTFMRGGKIYG